MSPRSLACLAAALAACLLAPPSRAEGRWCVSFSASQAITSPGLHGSGLDASAIAEVHPLLGLGIETGTSYMRVPAAPELVGFRGTDGAGAAIAGVTDGITRNRGYYLGPVARLGGPLALVASAGYYELDDGGGHAFDARWGESAGIVLGGRGRREGFAELRARFIGAPSARSGTLQFGVGMQLR